MQNSANKDKVKTMAKVQSYTNLKQNSIKKIKPNEVDLIQSPISKLN